MATLTRHDYQQSITFVRDLCEEADSVESIARMGVRRLPALAGSELTTLSVCDLRHATRSVVSFPEQAISAADRACFDRYFTRHPLVRYHSTNLDGGSHRISDSLAWSRFRETGLYNEYYRRIGIDHVIAVPLFVDSDLLVSFVLNRTRRDFSERDRAVLDLVRRPLARLYRSARAIELLQAQLPGKEGFRMLRVTAREREILDWLAAGKTDRDIAAILGVSPRTVQKHLEHLYVKLGVETRTAAVMRSLALSRAANPAAGAARGGGGAPPPIGRQDEGVNRDASS